MELKWIPASKLRITSEEIEEKYEGVCSTETKVFPGYVLKLIRFDKIKEDLISTWKQNQQDIVEAELQHSDLIPAKYEGKFKPKTDFSFSKHSIGFRSSCNAFELK